MRGALIVGIDEAGRAPLAGPVFAAAVILPDKFRLPGLKDSKQLSHHQRERLAELIRKQAIFYAVGQASVEEIDQINIFQASLLAMRRAFDALKIDPHFVWVDGQHCPDFPCPAQAMIRGDQLIPVVSAASILAKVDRDHEMIKWDAVYPGYGFARHKGYPTREHRKIIKELGITPIHRKSFRPVKELLLKESSSV